MSEKINENEQIPGSPPGLGNLEKTPLTWLLKKLGSEVIFFKVYGASDPLDVG